MRCDLYEGNNLELLQRYIDDEEIDLIYIDPPFNTGKVQKRKNLQYNDIFEDLSHYIDFLKKRFKELYRVLKPTGSFFLHVDYRAVHYLKIELDKIFGIDSFLNEIIWAYDYGARQKSKWPTKHDTILCYVKNPKQYTFNYDEMDRIPYMAPGLVGKEKAAKGKTPTDVWWHTIVGTRSKENCGYPTQKPLGVLERIIKIHSNPKDLILDCFAGSGSFGEAAALNNRDLILMDKNPDAIDTILRRLAIYGIHKRN